MTTISRTEETFIPFSVQFPIRSYINKCGVEKLNELRFLESFIFMASSLDSLAQTLQDADLKLLQFLFKQLNDSDFKKMRAKGFFPYSYLDSFPKFELGFPAYGDHWKNTLTGRIDVTQEMYT